MSVQLVKDFLLFFVTILTYVSFVPQIVKILKTKKAEDISVLSWTLWVSSSFAYLLFSILEGRFRQYLDNVKIMSKISIEVDTPKKQTYVLHYRK